ncbi:MAG: hypothetical protein G01um101448_41 [Parcubacteria group bacterium Gr01-1014_48]|nr:MAG: hypothetical protein Greene041614_403 [Parcubacteria group bacterium Greene0416_14]TSC74626.1 MAG: hypothetical protein G01um101448_41 [Parcubacteria group bacterium Gr01-1014_48]TSD01575.1 MAG: hypothetical protein Greene101415_155 [Parcubacteria group bacterium Greene1014_15]
MSTGNLYLPSFYNPSHAELWNYHPDARALFEFAKEYREEWSITAAAYDAFKLLVLGIDLQRDFGHPLGSLYVGGRSGTGAIDDNRRTAEWTYKNLPRITRFMPTLDTHTTLQIFFPGFLIDQNGEFLQPHDMVTDGMDILRFGKTVGKAYANPAVAGVLANGNTKWMQKQIEHYCAELNKAQGTLGSPEMRKYMLYTWPEHCLLGGEGHNVVGVIQEAMLFHSYVRHALLTPEIKGGNPWTENYSVFSPEVLTRWSGKPLARKNKRLINLVLGYDAIVVLGQAKSHCVASSIYSLLEEIVTVDPSLAKKVYIVDDCMSSVVVPNSGYNENDPASGPQYLVDFTEKGDEYNELFREYGMHVVKSTDDIATWPGLAHLN